MRLHSDTFHSSHSGYVVESHSILGLQLAFGNCVPLMDVHVSIVRPNIMVTMETRLQWLIRQK